MLLKFAYVAILFLVLSFFSNAEKTTIKILTKSPDMPETLNAEVWEENYNKLINEYFTEKTPFKDVEILFDFYEYEPVNNSRSSIFFDYIQDVTAFLEEGEYDMLLLDDKMLFIEESFMETDWIFYYHNEHRKLTTEFFMDLSSYTKDQDLSFNNKKLLNHARKDGGLYALPYDMDFDVLYYKDDNAIAKNMASKMESIYWDDVVHELLPSNPLKISLGDDNDLLNLFSEYTVSHYDIDGDPEFYKMFYNETADEFYKSFREFIYTYAGNYNDTLGISLDDAYGFFMNGTSTFFKGKASHYSLLTTTTTTNNNNDNNGNGNGNMNTSNTDNITTNNNANTDANTNAKANANTNANANANTNTNANDNANTNAKINTKSSNNVNSNTNGNANGNAKRDIELNPTVNNNDINNINKPVNSQVQLCLPPKHISAFTGNYLAVNNYSTLDKKLLVDVAVFLTSKDMQVFRAVNFGKVPSFDMSKKTTDKDIENYCLFQADICNAVESMKDLDIKKVFKSKYSVPFYEVEVILPVKIRKSLIINNDLESIKFNFENMHELLTEHLGIYGTIAYVFTIAMAILFFVIIYLVYKNRNHPYLKVISPMFCIVILFGCTLNMFKGFQNLPPFFEMKPKIILIYEAFCINMIFVPMFAVTFRIYRIFKSETIITRALTNKRLGVITVLLMSVGIIFRCYIVYKDEFYYLPFGSINQPRYPEATYKGNEKFDEIYQTYLYTIFTALLFMIINTGRISRKFGDVSYTIVIFILNISDFLVTRLMEKLSHENYPQYFLLIMIFNGLITLFCVYILVGSRLLFIYLFPSELNSMSGTNIISASDLMDFLPLKASKNKYISLLDRVNRNKGFHTSSSSSFTDNRTLRMRSPYASGTISGSSISGNGSSHTGNTTKFYSPNTNSPSNYTFLGKDYKSYNNLSENGYRSPPFGSVNSNIGFSSSPSSNNIMNNSMGNSYSNLYGSSPRSYASNEYYHNIINQNQYDKMNNSLPNSYRHFD